MAQWTGETKKKKKKDKGEKVERRRTRNSNIFSKSREKDEKVNNVQSMQPWMLVRLKYKIMILTLGVLEMRKDDAIIKRVIRAIPLDILKENMMQIYKDYKHIYKKSYTMDCLQHVS